LDLLLETQGVRVHVVVEKGLQDELATLETSGVFVYLGFYKGFQLGRGQVLLGGLLGGRAGLLFILFLDRLDRGLRLGGYWVFLGLSWGLLNWLFLFDNLRRWLLNRSCWLLHWLNRRLLFGFKSSSFFLFFLLLGSSSQLRSIFFSFLLSLFLLSILLNLLLCLNLSLQLRHLLLLLLTLTRHRLL
jgi:hypothetical protein